MKRILISLAVSLALLAGPAATASGPAQASGARTVDINHFAYHPHTLRIAKGTTVVFSNSAPVEHTATDRGVFDSGHIKPGHSFSVHFERRGTFAYHCKIHTFMHGKIVVG